MQNSINKFKVIHVITSPCGGGAEFLVRELTRRTNNLGISCKAVYFNYSAECTKKIDFSDNVMNLNMSYRNPFAIISLRKKSPTPFCFKLVFRKYFLYFNWFN